MGFIVIWRKKKKRERIAHKKFINAMWSLCMRGIFL
jgi:hypothetical protein